MTSSDQIGISRLHERIKHLHGKCENYLRWKTKMEKLLNLPEGPPEVLYNEIKKSVEKQGI